MITTLIENMKNWFPENISGQYFEECYKVYEELNIIKTNCMDYVQMCNV